MSKGALHIGTSGWSYPHWKDNFYPKGLKAADWLNFYAQTFSTVEINTTFYHTPRIETVKKWYTSVPEDFLFSIKASRYITHLKRLKNCEEAIAFFYSSLRPFKEKAGPILLQLPPSLKVDKERLHAFIALLNDKYRYTFEFRDPSWFNDEIYSLLTRHKIALCITDLGGNLSPEEVTTDFTYIRLHGPRSMYQGYYGSKALKSWQKKIDKWREKGISIFCYFDNDEKGYAIQDAKMLCDFYH